MAADEGPWLTVQQAGAELGVNDARVRQLIDSGDLGAKRFGRAWRIDRRSVLRRKRSSPQTGRPLEPSMCWLVIASVEDPLALDAVPSWQATRAKRHRRRLLEGHATAPFRRRAERIEGYIHPGLRAQLAESSVAAGAAAQPPDLSDRLLDEAIQEVYTSADEWPGLADAVGFDVAGPPEVIVHVVAPEHWSVLAGRVQAPPVVAALDLAERGDDRARRASDQILDRLWEQTPDSGAAS